ncbi:MAG: FHA domain-containing serine/threonine-protein kinase [Planctomycetaceae bacterium]
MARILRPGDTVEGLRVSAEISRGAQATCYLAERAVGERVFLKQYKSPSQRVCWYREFIRYQEQLRRRIDESRCIHFCYRQLLRFEREQCLFQGFEFLDSSCSLRELLLSAARKKGSLKGEQRLILAKVLVSGVSSLHEQKIVHADLKPENVMLLPDSSISSGYRLRLIDMDFSLLTDIQAPWHGHEGYFGTPQYFSPEHLRGAVPGTPADLFTLGLILYEVLGTGHPFTDKSDEEYREAIVAGRVPALQLVPELKSMEHAAEIRKTLAACFDPQPAARPTAAELLKVLNGRSTPSPKIPSIGILCLTGPNSKVRRFNLPQTIGRDTARIWGEDYRYLSERQFQLLNENGQWSVHSLPGAVNMTLLNGTPVSDRMPLRPGDVIAVGNPKTGVCRLPLTVEFLAPILK